MLTIEKAITVKLKWGLDETKLYFVNAGIPLKESFILKDIYLVKDNIDFKKSNSLDVLSSSIIIREVIEDNNVSSKSVIYKDKKYDEKGNIISSLKYSCKIESIEAMYDILTKTGYKECFRYEQECLAYETDKCEVLLEYIPDLGLFLELENNKSNEELVADLNSLHIPYYENDYFVKKAVLMLEKEKRRIR